MNLLAYTTVVRFGWRVLPAERMGGIDIGIGSPGLRSCAIRRHPKAAFNYKNNTSPAREVRLQTLGAIGVAMLQSLCNSVTHLIMAMQDIPLSFIRVDL